MHAPHMRAHRLPLLIEPNLDPAILDALVSKSTPTPPCEAWENRTSIRTHYAEVPPTPLPSFPVAHPTPHPLYAHDEVLCHTHPPIPMRLSSVHILR